MNKLEIVKAFLSDPEIQQKYNLRANDVEQMTLANQHPSPVVGLIRRMVELVESDTTPTTIASQLNAYLENVLRP